MLKEATSNILKHAAATIIEISISFDSANCHFSISDNGRGIGKGLFEKGMGMESMDLRIRRIKGKTVMHSSSTGTIIEGFFPLI
jgi:signal transduction histidine kinase